MKIFKIKHNEFGNLSKLIVRIGAFEESNGQRQAFPEKLYVSPRTATKMRNCIKLIIKREYPYLAVSSNKFKSVLEMEWLNLGPQVVKGVADGFVIYAD